MRFPGFACLIIAGLGFPAAALADAATPCNCVSNAECGSGTCSIVGGGGCAITSNKVGLCTGGGGGGHADPVQNFTAELPRGEATLRRLNARIKRSRGAQRRR